MAESAEILVDDAEHVRTVTLNRPERLNALTLNMRREIESAVTEFGQDDNLRVLILTGAGRGFCSGTDLRDGGVVEKRTIRERTMPRFWWHRAFDEVEKPTICALNGVAAGARLGLALSCDLIIASEDASITPAFSKLGLSPDNGVAQMLQRRVGYSRALRVLLLSSRLSAAEAAAMGLVDEVVPAAVFAESVRRLAQELTKVSPIASVLTKRLLKDAPSLPRHVELAYEELLFDVTSATPEAAAAREAWASRSRD